MNPNVSGERVSGWRRAAAVTATVGAIGALGLLSRLEAPVADVQPPVAEPAPLVVEPVLPVVVVGDATCMPALIKTEPGQPLPLECGGDGTALVNERGELMVEVPAAPPKDAPAPAPSEDDAWSSVEAYLATHKPQAAGVIIGVFALVNGWEAYSRRRPPATAEKQPVVVE